MIIKNILRALIGLTLLGLLFGLSFRNYVLFHSLVEIAATSIGLAVFLFAWNSRHFENRYLTYIGISFAPVFFLTVLHLLSFKGFQAFNNTTNLATQLWLLSRSFLAVSIVITPILVRRSVSINLFGALQGVLAAIAIILVFNGYFPVAHIEGLGLTRFKIYAEYVIILLFGVSLLNLNKLHAFFPKNVLSLLRWFLGYMILAELLFTAYFDAFDISNAVGHLFMLLGFYCFYKAILETGLKRPLDLLFKDLQAANQRWKAILDNVYDAIFIHDLEGRVVQVNERMLSLYQVSREEALQYSIGKDYSGPNAPADFLPTIWNKVIKGEPQLLEWEARKPHSGELFDVEVFLSRFDLDDQPFILANVRDISERKRAQKIIQQSQQDLKEALATRDDFISIASHELKTPMTSLQLQLELMDKVVSSIQTEERKTLGKFLNLARAQLKRLSQLTSSLLDITRIRAGKFEYHFVPVNLSELIKDVTERMNEEISKAGCSVRFSKPEVIECLCDRVRIEQVMTNLISNAVKYAPGGPITISLQALTSHDSKIACINVSDSGPGISPEDQKRIFNRFERSDRSTTVSGLGLGLYIVRRIIEDHAGTVTVQSQFGHGATFSICLPLRPKQS